MFHGVGARTATLAVVTAMLVGGVCGSAPAAQIIPGTDLDTNSLDGIATSETDDFITSSEEDIGDLTNRVFQDEDTYIYTHEVTPQQIANASEFNTGFAPRGFDGTTGSVGWDFEQAEDAGGNGISDDFQITWNDDTDGTIDWEPLSLSVEDPDDPDAATGEWWDSGELITFFFESDLPPAETLADYNLINSETGTAQSFQPVPAPAALPAGLALLGMMGFGRWRRTRRRPTTLH